MGVFINGFSWKIQLKWMNSQGAPYFLENPYIENGNLNKSYCYIRLLVQYMIMIYHCNSSTRVAQKKQKT